MGNFALMSFNTSVQTSSIEISNTSLMALNSASWSGVAASSTSFSCWLEYFIGRSTQGKQIGSDKANLRRNSRGCGWKLHPARKRGSARIRSNPQKSRPAAARVAAGSKRRAHCGLAHYTKSYENFLLVAALEGCQGLINCNRSKAE